MVVVYRQLKVRHLATIFRSLQGSSYTIFSEEVELRKRAMVSSRSANKLSKGGNTEPR